MSRPIASISAAVVVACVLTAAPAAAVGPSDVLQSTLPNGLRVAIVRDPVGPVVTTEMNYLVGSDESPAGFPGMAHAAEHMLFRGSPGLSAAQLTAITAELGGDVNADTRQTVTQYHFTVPADDLDVVLKLEAIRMRSVDDSDDDWNRERGAIEQEVAQDDSSPASVYFRHLYAAAFAGTPYAVDGLGTRPSFDATTAPMLRDFHKAWYGPNNAILVIAGDVDPAKTLAQVRSLFGSIPARPTPPRTPIALQPAHHLIVPAEARFPFKVAFESFRLPGYDSPDFVAGQILEDVLQSKRSALAQIALRGDALDVETDQLPPLPAAGLSTIIGIAPPLGDDSRMIDAMHAALTAYAEHGVPDDLVQAAKKRELAEEAETQASVPLVAREWSEALAVGGRSSPAVDMDAIANVTTADVDRVAHTVLEPSVTIESAPVAPHTNGAAAAATSDSFAPEAAKPVPLPDWAATKLLALHPPSFALASVRDERLANGVRVIAVPEPGTTSVEVLGDVRTSPQLETPAGQEGVADLENDLFDYGSTTLDREQYQAAVDAIGADETTGTKFSIKMLASDMDRGLQLLSDVELNPAFPASAFDTVRERDMGVMEGRSNSARYQMDRAIDKALYPLADPVLRQATPDSIASLSLDDVKAYYRRTFRPDLATIVVIGGVTSSDAVAEVQKWFGAWGASGPPPAVELPAVPDNAAASSVMSPPGDEQDFVSMSETLGIVRSSDDYYALRLGDEVLGGPTLASRLYEDLREQRGLTYFVGSQLDVGKTRSTFTLNFGCDPGNVAQARKIVREDLVAMQTQAVAPDVLQRAKALLVRQIPLGQSSEDRIADGLLDAAEAGLPLDEPTTAAQRYLALGPADVMKAFARWIRPDGFAQVVEGPYPH